MSERNNVKKETAKKQVAEIIKMGWGVCMGCMGGQKTCDDK